MTRFRQALLVSALATGAVTAAWMWVSRRRATDATAGAQTDQPPQRERTRDEEIEDLTQQQKDLMLRELSQHL